MTDPAFFRELTKQAGDTTLDKHNNVDFGLDVALRLFIEHYHPTQPGLARACSVFALKLYENDPAIWLSFAREIRRRTPDLITEEAV